MGENFFQLDTIDFGIGKVEVAINQVEGKITLEINANQITTENIGANEPSGFGWVLYPPKLYFRNVPFVQTAGGRQIVVDEQLLDNYDIALYLLDHYDVLGIAELTETTFTFVGNAQVDGVETAVAVSCMLPH